MSHDFLDEARIFVAAGKGGDGSVHFRREKFVPLGGPDGGDGGHGGSVILESDAGMNTLYRFRARRRFVAEPGSAGSGNRRHGKAGLDVVVKVPVGTTVRDGESGELLYDLTPDGERQVVVRGGRGGLGNQHFSTSTHQAPAFAEKGQPGEERWLQLELKLVADVGLVGLPNAGKSTLLASVSAARPKIADYPFTTLIPNLGVVAMDDYSFVVADMPGLIEGAHGGRGLGDTFLRHIERTRLLVRVVDLSDEDPIEDFEQVTEELRLYDPNLLERPQIVALSKIDLPDARSNMAGVSSALESTGFEVFPVSGVTHSGLDQLITAIRVRLEELPRPELTEEEREFVFTARSNPDQFSIERKRGTFTVRGETVERIMSMTDQESSEALEHLQRRLKRLGVLQALEREGIRPGNRVSIGPYDLTWEGELEQGVVRRDEQRARENHRRSGRGTRAYRERRRG